MSNDERHSPYQPQYQQDPYQGWSYEQQQPMEPPPNTSPPAQRYPYQPHPSSAGSQFQPSPYVQNNRYNPDLTMNMGDTLGYTQGLQYNTINMAQPSEEIPRQYQDYAPYAPEEYAAIPRASVETVRSSTSAPANWAPTHNAPDERVSAATPAQDTAALQRVRLGKVSSIISIAFAGSSVLGLVQTFLFTYIFGRYATGEAYLQAYIIPNLIFTVISGGALSSAFIPVFTFYAEKNKDEKTAWHVASSALNLSTILMILLAIVMMFLTPVLVPLYSKASEVPLIITLTRIMLLQAIVLGSGVIVGAILNTKQDFTRTALGTVLYNIGLILGLIPGFIFASQSHNTPPPELAVYIATFGVVLGALLQVGVQIPGLPKVGMQYSFAFDWKHPGVHKIVRQMIPRVINAMMLSFSTAVDRYFISYLKTGGSTGLLNPYMQAFSIMVMPITLFSSSVSTAAFPTLASYVARGRFERVRNIIMETLRNILFLTVPSSIGLIILALPITQTLLEHGNFDLIAAQYASVVLIFFAIGIPAQAAIEILTRSFYALQDSRTPVTISVLQFVAKIALSVILFNLADFGVQWGLGVLAFSTSAAATLEALALFVVLSQRLGAFELRPFMQFVGRVLLASVALAIVLLIARNLLDHMIDTTSMNNLSTGGVFQSLFKLLIELGLGSAAFLVSARLLKMEEMNTGLVRRVIRLLRIPWL